MDSNEFRISDSDDVIVICILNCKGRLLNCILNKVKKVTFIKAKIDRAPKVKIYKTKF